MFSYPLTFWFTQWCSQTLEAIQTQFWKQVDIFHGKAGGEVNQMRRRKIWWNISNYCECSWSHLENLITMEDGHYHLSIGEHSILFGSQVVSNHPKKWWVGFLFHGKGCWGRRWFQPSQSWKPAISSNGDLCRRKVGHCGTRGECWQQIDFGTHQEQSDSSKDGLFKWMGSKEWGLWSHRDWAFAQ